ncbi:MAG: DNA/RNA non-specific endonuclease, partial [Acidobacteria bacterium]|nr:DNA/RNA non-specific endonuclease [Acidobacteriota bacterium]
MSNHPQKLLFISIAFVLLVTCGCGRIDRRVDDFRERIRQIESAPDEDDGQILPMGNPSGATADPGNEDNFLLIKKSSVVSYNNRRGTANWIYWRTTGSDLGEPLLRPDFQPDPTLPDSFISIFPSHYSGSGYDRGHLVPSADRFGDADTNAETFHMTNIVPQSASLNQYTWEKLERNARGIVRRGGEVHTFAGVYGESHRLKNRVTVPTNCWKIIIVMKSGGGSAELINDKTRIIA